MFWVPRFIQLFLDYEMDVVKVVAYYSPYVLELSFNLQLYPHLVVQNSFCFISASDSFRLNFKL
jgi:hypothetical protein